MAMKLITGVTFDAVTSAVYEEIKANGISDSRHIVIVPDQYALMCEKEVLEYLQIKGSFNIEVLSFSRFAVKVLGRRVNKSLNQYTSVMLLKKLAIDHAEELKCFSKVVKKNGYINELYATITNIRNSDISPEAFRASIPSLSGITQSKAEDIAILFEAYDKELKSHYSDIGSCLEQLASAISGLEWVSSTHFYITDFHELTGVKLNIIRAICDNSLSTTIGIAYDETAENLRIQPKALVDYIYYIAKHYNIGLERVILSNQLAGAKQLVASRLFGYNLRTQFSCDDSFQIFSADSESHEIKSIARKIREDIINGYRYKDIAVICADSLAVKDSIKREFNAFNIPFYMDIKADFYTNAVCRIFLRAVSMVDKNYARNAVIAFVKEGLFDVSEKEKNTFIQFILKYNINYNKFLSTFSIGIDDAMYSVSESVRAKMLEIVRYLLVDSTDTREIISGIKGYYLAVFGRNNLTNYLQRLRDCGEDLNAQITELCVKKIGELLDSTAEIFAENNLNKEELFNILLSTFEAIQVSVVPQYIDNVFVGTANKSKLSNVKIIYLIGASEGHYPNTQSENNVLNTADLAVLAEHNVTISPNTKDKFYNDKFFCMQTLLKASDKVIISYNASKEKSILVEQLCKILGLNIQKFISNHSSFNTSIQDYALKIGTYDNAKVELMRYAGERLNGVHLASEQIYDYLYTRLDDRGDNHILYQPKPLDRVDNHSLPWSVVDGKIFCNVSAVETFMKCPFKFYAQNVLRLKEQYSSDITAADLGSYVHRILELFFTRVKDFSIDEQGIRHKVCDYTDEIFRKGEFLAIQNALNAISVEKKLIDRCVYALVRLCKNQLRSKFHVAECEANFGMRNSKLPPFVLEKGDNKYHFSGKIDRIDKYNDYFVIVDYKTSASLDANYKNIYNGTRVQLLFYMNAYLANTADTPLGVMYMTLPYKYINLSDKDDLDNPKDGYKYKGFLRNLEQGIGALDNDYLGGDTFLPIAIKKDKKTGNHTLDDGSVLTESDFKLLLDYAKSVVMQAIDDINSGYIAPRPIDCEYCVYGNVCKSYNNLDNKRKMPNVVLHNDTTDEIVTE